MAKQATFPSMKRFGTRYGKTVRDRFGAIEIQQRKTYPCPKCGYVRVTRISTGIWSCTKCGVKIASRAYQVGVTARPEEV